MDANVSYEELERLSRAGVWRYDLAGDRFEWSGGAAHLLTPERAPPRSLAGLLTQFAEPSRTYLRLALERAAIDGARIDLELDLEPEPDRPRRLRLTGTTQLLKRRPVRVEGCLIDVGERERLEEENRQLRETVRGLSQVDALTGLPNLAVLGTAFAERRLLDRYGEAEHALFYFDVDRFKLVNDTCGHEEGDRMLRELAGVLRDALRPGDLLMRIGGDEFAAMISGCAGRAAMLRAQALIDRVSEHRFMADGYPYPLGISVGVAPIDGDVNDANRLLSHAGTACFVAKQSGGGRAHLYRRSDESVTGARRDMTSASRLGAAIEQNRIELYGQRIVSLTPGALPSYEVLIRVREADGTVTSPQALLSAAYRFGLTGRLERHVVRSVLQLLAALDEAGLAGWDHLSVNLTGTSIADPQFADFLLEALAQCPVPAARLYFEITETAAVNDDEGARALIARLRARGHRILLDDFGTGFTSFNYFKTLGVDGIKIDRNFTADLTHDDTNRAVVEALCRLGAGLELVVIAEGVEDEATLARLQALGVTHIQGWLFHRAEPLAQVLGSGTVAA